MIGERILIRVSQIIGVMVILLLIYTHFFGWIGSKVRMEDDIRDYLYAEGVTERDIVSVEAEFDRKSANPYVATVVLLREGDITETVQYAYDVEEKIYMLGEKK